jgi:hypothetical protein
VEVSVTVFQIAMCWLIANELAVIAGIEWRGRKS